MGTCTKVSRVVMETVVRRCWRFSVKTECSEAACDGRWLLLYQAFAVCQLSFSAIYISFVTSEKCNLQPFTTVLGFTLQCAICKVQSCVLSQLILFPRFTKSRQNKDGAVDDEQRDVGNLKSKPLDSLSATIWKTWGGNCTIHEILQKISFYYMLFHGIMNDIQG